MTEASGPPQIPAGLGLGCWEFGDMGSGPVNAGDSIALIRHAFERGITHFDTAQDYGNGRSEEVIAEAVSPFAGRAFIASKAHAAGPGQAGPIIERTLRRLRRGWLDLFYIHWPRTGLDLRPMMEDLESQRRRGKIRLIGVSNFGVSEMENASQAGHIDAHQICYNLLWRYPENEVIPWCREHGVALVTYSSIAQGLLSDTPRSPLSFEKGDARRATLYYRPDVWPHVQTSVAAMRQAAGLQGTPLSTLAIRWVLGEGVVSCLVGARSRAQLDQNAEAASGHNSLAVDDKLTRLSEEAMQQIPDAGNIFQFYP